MWGKIIIPMYSLWLNGLYGLYGPRCPLFSKRPINLISLSLISAVEFPKLVKIAFSDWNKSLDPCSIWIIQYTNTGVTLVNAWQTCRDVTLTPESSICAAHLPQRYTIHPHCPQVWNSSRNSNFNRICWVHYFRIDCCIQLSLLKLDPWLADFFYIIFGSGHGGAAVLLPGFAFNW